MGYLLNIYKDDNKIHENLQKDTIDEVVFKEENELVSITGRGQIVLIADALEMSRLETEEYGIIDKAGLLKIEERIHSGSYTKEWEKCDWLSEKERLNLLDNMKSIVNLIEKSIHQNGYVLVWHDIND
ncbi:MULTISPECIES: hypothetical protein [Bacillus cereus group]|uniref:Uncharacterized protein n=2 Tax=Bacillus cereus group TaxID=86661 RepID=A0A9W7UNE6_BACCE|nr:MULTISPECIES: hypothetical protein [Bacillus cereus group]EEM56039.1 hypothetical protein bthur0007_61480 [Bacillus thuringiensis serovar monterrey BGSC 4AJ1]KAA6448241.1 hypothetical protein DX932_31870 [Bacillus cereus]MEB9673895.1 hypothetical protein [Bacillus anthracis]OTW50920.1 hypothetical protein BK699_10275 [Bacillus thuringiensis serovar mexicanensis]OTX09605.1 hypothetical protein BK705_05320 [Bacillus thuringiensis serovar monterrey]